MPNFTAQTLADIFRTSTSMYSTCNWCRTVDGNTAYTYGEFGACCDTLSKVLCMHGIGAGDKVAIFSSGTPHWSMAFFTATAFGRTAVPMLPDFSGVEADHVIEHSEAKALFVGKKQFAKLSEETIAKLDIIFDIETLDIIKEKEKPAKEARTADPKPEDLAAIIYTSGTTGAAKGVMLTHRNFVSNVLCGIKYFPLNNKDVMLSILPLAHAYELSLGMIYPFYCGASICYISKAPTPTYLMRVMKEVRPTAMLTVPLIIEKVYKGTILPMVKKSRFLTWMDKHFNKLLCRLIGKRMVKTFGGRLRFFGIGGAKLDIDVERFLHKARFPYHIGYGLTECAPLLCLARYNDTIPGQIGRPVYGMELKLDNVNPSTGEGEIVAKGPNIMPGYYKDPERTADAFNADGWFRTKDIASVDAQGRYCIKGRIGNMILGASGENIYPEEIEKVVKEIPLVEDVIVIARGSKLVCLVKAADSLIDAANAESSEASKEAVERFKATVKDYTNARVSNASQLNTVEVMKEPFEKTATLKIRRYLYKDNAPTM